MKIKINKKNKKSDRFNGLIGVMCVIFSLIVLKLLSLQVFNYEDFKERADNRSMRFMSDKAPRGKIYDKNGNVLAANKQTYTLTFTETDESKKNFYSIMDKVFKILSDNGEKIQDNLDLVIKDGNMAFDFGSDNEENIKAAEIRFKKDRGLDDKIRKTFYPKEQGELTPEQNKKIQDTLLSVTPEQMFEYLIEQYDMKQLLIKGKTFANEDEEKEFRKSFNQQYKDKKGKEILDELRKTYSLEQIRQYMVVKDAAKMQSFSSFKAVSLAQGIKDDTASIFYQKLNDLPGIDISQDPVRYYPYNDLASSVLGYVGAIPGSEQSKYKDRGYDLSSDLIGKSGIESAFEDQLKGTKGGEMVKVNTHGRPIESLYALETTPGNSITLSIDKDVQASTERMLKTQLEYIQKSIANGKNATRGAAVAINVKTGKVLSMASYPSFDPNVFAAGSMQGDKAKELMSPNLESFGQDFIKRMGLNKSVDELFPKDENGYRQDLYDVYPKPMYNYATLGFTQPGSTFKPLSSIAGLEEGVINTTETISDGAVLGSGLRFIKYADLIGTPKDNKNHGTVNVKSALQKSCNSFYYETAIRLYRKYNSSIESLDSIAKYAWKFGLGKDPNSNTVAGTGIEISENFGNTYNFETFKKNTIYYMRWDLVEAMRNGKFKGGYEFTPVEIGKNDSDTQEVAEAKEKYKDTVAKYLNQIGQPDFASAKMKEEFKKEIIGELKNLYKVLPSYKETIDNKVKNSKSSADELFDKTAQETYDWMTTTVKMSITTPAELAFSAIGQSINRYTPLQLASYIGTLVNGGTRYKVSLVDKISDYQGNLIQEVKPVVLDKVDISKTSLDAVKEGMRMVNQDPSGGTAYSVFGNFPISTGGKTGTATFKTGQEELGRQAFGVYVSFAPVEDPEIAVAVVTYDGINGYLGSPVARAIYETYWRDELKTKYPSYKPKTMAGDEYTYTLNPDLPDVKDDQVYYKLDATKEDEKNGTENGEEAKDNIKKEENSLDNVQIQVEENLD